MRSVLSVMHAGGKMDIIRIEVNNNNNFKKSLLNLQNKKRS